jgi:hypothetical protein
VLQAFKGSVLLELGPYAFYAGPVDGEVLASDTTCRADVDDLLSRVQPKLNVVCELQRWSCTLSVQVIAGLRDYRRRWQSADNIG